MPRDSDLPRLVFTPRAWLKWQFLCHAGPTEIGAFALSNDQQPLLLEDLLVVKQATTSASVAFDDVAVAELFETMTDSGIPPRQFARVWLHTHPGASVTPSGIDEATFQRVFGHCDWAVMGILGRTGRTYARLRFNAGPIGALEIATSVDWSRWPDYATSQQFQNDIDYWRTEFERLVEPVPYLPASPKTESHSNNPVASIFDPWLSGDFDPFLTGVFHDDGNGFGGP